MSLLNFHRRDRWWNDYFNAQTCGKNSGFYAKTEGKQVCFKVGNYKQCREVNRKTKLEMRKVVKRATKY